MYRRFFSLLLLLSSASVFSLLLSSASASAKRWEPSTERWTTKSEVAEVFRALFEGGNEFPALIGTTTFFRAGHESSDQQQLVDAYWNSLAENGSLIFLAPSDEGGSPRRRKSLLCPDYNGLRGRSPPRLADDHDGPSGVRKEVFFSRTNLGTSWSVLPAPQKEQTFQLTFEDLSPSSRDEGKGPPGSFRGTLTTLAGNVVFSQPFPATATVSDLEVTLQRWSGLPTLSVRSPGNSTESPPSTDSPEEKTPCTPRNYKNTPAALSPGRGLLRAAGEGAVGVNFALPSFVVLEFDHVVSVTTLPIFQYPPGDYSSGFGTCVVKDAFRAHRRKYMHAKVDAADRARFPPPTEEHLRIVEHVRAQYFGSVQRQDALKMFFETLFAHNVGVHIFTSGTSWRTVSGLLSLLWFFDEGVDVDERRLWKVIEAERGM